MDNMHNHHESIGLFKVGLVGNFGFGGFGCFGFLFVCLFVVQQFKAPFGGDFSFLVLKCLKIKINFS